MSLRSLSFSLTSEQIGDITNKWCDRHNDDPNRRKWMKHRFHEAIKTSGIVQELAANPMLLDVLLRCNNDSRYEALSTYRKPLYAMCSRILLQDWDIKRAIEGTGNDDCSIDDRDKREILRTVASKMKWHCRDFNMPVIPDYELQTVFEEYFAKNRFDDPQQTAKVLIEQLSLFDNHILYYAGYEFHGFYGFAHQGFLDYFRADDIVYRFEKKREIDLKFLKEYFFGRWYSTWRHGYLSLITAMIDVKFASEIIDYLISQNGEQFEFNNLLLATKCITSIKWWQKSLAEQAKRLRYSLSLRLSDDMYPENVVIQVRAALYELKE
ncbi:hypothetical protein QT972_31495 [Microcoleus sp. herbarium7]